MIFSKNSAFKPWKPPKDEISSILLTISKRDKTKQPAELLRKYAKRLFLVYKSKNITPIIKKNKVFLLKKEQSEPNMISKLSREELYIFIKSVLGKEAFSENPNWESLWAVFRRKFLKNPYVKDVPVNNLFIKNGTNLKLNKYFW